MLLINDRLLNSSIVFNQTTTTTNKTGPFLCPLPNNNNEPSVYSGRTPCEYTNYNFKFKRLVL